MKEVTFLLQEPFFLRVIDLKQYVYCPRILYYHTVLADVRPITYKMEAGQEAHRTTEGREKRRSLRSYGLKTGERTFNVALQNEALGLSGEIDMVIETDDELIPVDFKLAKREGKHFRLQVMAYGRLLEDSAEAHHTKPVRRGFLYLIPKRKAVEVRFTPHLRRQFDRALEAMRHITLTQQMPNATAQQRRCVDCEFRRFCNDVL